MFTFSLSNTTTILLFLASSLLLLSGQSRSFSLEAFQRRSTPSPGANVKVTACAPNADAAQCALYKRIWKGVKKTGTGVKNVMIITTSIVVTWQALTSFKNEIIQLWSAVRRDGTALKAANARKELVRLAGKDGLPPLPNLRPVVATGRPPASPRFLERHWFTMVAIVAMANILLASWFYFQGGGRGGEEAEVDNQRRRRKRGRRRRRGVATR